MVAAVAARQRVTWLKQGLLPVAFGIDFLPGSPLSRRYVPVFACTGDALVVWGGFVPGLCYFRDGARYELGSGEWTVMPEAPLAARVPAASAWTGRELCIVGGAGDNWAVLADGA